MLIKLFYYEFITLLRQTKEWLYPLTFFFIVMSLLPLAFRPEPDLMRELFPGFLWIAAIFSIMLSVQQIFCADFEDAHILQLYFSDQPLALLLSVKLAAYWSVTELPLILLTPLFGLMFQLPSSIYFMGCLVLLMGTPIVLLICCLAYILTLGLRQQGVLISLLILPLLIPVIIFGVNIIQQSSLGFNIQGPLLFLGGLTFLSISTIPIIMAEALKLGLDD